MKISFNNVNILHVYLLYNAVFAILPIIELLRSR